MDPPLDVGLFLMALFLLSGSLTQCRGPRCSYLMFEMSQIGLTRHLRKTKKIYIYIDINKGVKMIVCCVVWRIWKGKLEFSCVVE
ncbi:hypothetical protein MtrunA17_Chr8g0349791 [Medicago truncatula]|uniref:Transmembrane protein n=1 Tax=Medicago truncatula TaxID=3880 RepID=A0A396GIJ2_MEDTR|nr:hypothetical protein MtrunA17_Chr8g0349791 [Medicago truncatula]